MKRGSWNVLEEVVCDRSLKRRGSEAQRQVQRLTFGRLFVDPSVYQCMSHDLYNLQVGAFGVAASGAEGQRRSVKCRGKLAFLLDLLFTNACEHSGQRVMGALYFCAGKKLRASKAVVVWVR